MVRLFLKIIAIAKQRLSVFSIAVIYVLVNTSGVFALPAPDIYQQLQWPWYVRSSDNCAETSSPATAAGTNLPPDVIAAINRLKPDYMQAAAATQVPWQLLAAVHFRENSNDPNGDLQAGNPIGGPWNQAASYPYGHPTSIEQSAEFAAKELISDSSGGVIKKPINAPNPDPEAIKDTLFSYNGRAQVYAQQAADLGFNPTTQPYEGSPYVMNEFDTKHHNMKIITHDFGGLDGIDTRPGAFTVYMQLGGASGGGTSGCGCTASSGSSGTTVVLDPGHGPNFSEKDVTTGLNMVESRNVPEITEVWDVAQTVKTQLEAAGYKVLLTKQNVEGNGITFRDRANVANNANAAIAVSIHDDHGQSYAGFKQIYPQEVGSYRGSGATKTSFTDAAVADKSKQYSQIFQQERKAVEGGSPEVKLNSFAGRPGLEPGNIPMVQLFSKVPWVYNEVGASDNGGNLSSSQKDQYAKGIVNGVEKSVPISGSATSQSAGACTTGSAAQTAINYSWSDNRGSPYCNEKPAYKTAIDAAASKGQYTGANCDTNSSLHGIDCGGFVTRVMIDSGADPEYNYGGDTSKGAGNTWQQQQYLDEQVTAGKYIKVGAVNDTSSLQPGDIAINSDHTFIYVGKQPGFDENSASSSQGKRAPMASSAYFSNSAGSFMWYRLKN